MNSNNYHVCKSCGHLKILHKFIQGQNNDHHCRLCSCDKFIDYSNLWQILSYTSNIQEYKIKEDLIGPVNLRKCCRSKYVIIYIEISKIENQTKRYCLFFLQFYFLDGLFYRKILQKHYRGLFTEVMYPSGNGFKNTSHKRYQIKEKRLTNLSLMKLG
jgi:hypothetical protein